MAADPAEQFCVAEERSGHCAVVDGNFLYVWGGYVVRREEAAGGRWGRGREREGEREGGKPRGGAPPHGGGAGLRSPGGGRRKGGKRSGGDCPAALPCPSVAPTAPSASAAPRRAGSGALFTSARTLIGCRGSAPHRGGRFKWRRRLL